MVSEQDNLLISAFVDQIRRTVERHPERVALLHHLYGEISKLPGSPVSFLGSSIEYVDRPDLTDEEIQVALIDAAGNFAADDDVYAEIMSEIARALPRKP